MIGFGFEDDSGRRPLGGDDESILPLINVVFLLLIFFMVLGSITQADPFPIEPPVSDATADAGEGATVYLAADGTLWVNGRTVALDRLGDALRGARPSTLVRIKADGRVDAVRLVAVMEGLKGAGIDTVRLLTAQRGS